MAQWVQVLDPAASIIPALRYGDGRKGQERIGNSLEAQGLTSVEHAVEKQEIASK